MIQRILSVVGLLLSLTVSVAVAAPPHFNGSDDTQSTSSKSATPAASPTVATNPVKSDTPVTANATGAPATPAGETNGAKESGDSQSVAPVPEKKSTSWLSRLFRKRTPVTPNVVTRKKDGDLVNTEKRHKDIPDLLDTADLHHFEPGADVRWQVQASNVMCRMRQVVPQYGYVEFRQGVAQPFEFALYVDHPPGGSGVVQVSSEPPHWQHFIKAKKLGALEMESNDTVFTASAEWSRRLFIELNEGMQPVFRFWDAADASEDVEVYLSAIQFKDSLDKFYQCIEQLVKYDLKQVQLNVLHFNPDSSKMRKQTYEQLGEVLETTKVDSSINGVNLEIYTQRDGLEHYNFRLATRRAQAIRDYLIKHGVKEDIIFIKIHTKSKSEMAKLGYQASDVYLALTHNKIK
jgi:outer membrane protein OmpA-like peptidoglycan-associated protein